MKKNEKLINAKWAEIKAIVRNNVASRCCSSNNYDKLIQEIAAWEDTKLLIKRGKLTLPLQKNTRYLILEKIDQEIEFLNYSKIKYSDSTEIEKDKDNYFEAVKKYTRGFNVFTTFRDTDKCTYGYNADFNYKFPQNRNWFYRFENLLNTLEENGYGINQKVALTRLLSDIRKKPTHYPNIKAEDVKILQERLNVILENEKNQER